MRQTSLDTYRDIKDSGLLGNMQWKVYSFLFSHGPMTGRELDDAMAGAGETRTSYHKRLPELVRRGVVSCKEKRACRVTGRKAHEWDVTPLMPRAPEAAGASSNSSTITALLALLREACTALNDSGDLFARSKANAILRKIEELGQ